MRKLEIEKLVTELTSSIVDIHNFELVDVEYVKEGPHMYLRIYIDKPGGITIDDCQKVSEQLGEKLDEIDPIEENYFLEVSSPGLDRTLKNDTDLESNKDKDIEISLFKPLNGKKKYIGKLISFNNEKIIFNDDEIGEVDLEREYISKINLAVKF